MTSHARCRRRRDDGGAAAVEFALVASIFLTMVIGMLQYGFYFTDSISLRQGVREGARMGVVKNFPACGSASTDGELMSCNTKERVGALTGPTYVKVAAPDGWQKGNRLLVCAQVDTSKALSLLPMPHDGVAMSKTEMSIEVTGAPTGLPVVDPLPAGMSWSWCV